MSVAIGALLRAAAPPLAPMDNKTLCMKLWDDGFIVMDKPYILAVIPLITFILTLLFALFLLCTLPRFFKRQKDNPSPSRKIYLAFVWVLAIMNIIRSITNILQDNLPWSNMVIVVIESLSSSVILAIEASVVVFVLHAHLHVWSQLLSRVSLITGILWLLYLLGQIPLIYLNYAWISHNGYYSLYNYWIGINSAWALIYLILLVFKAIGSDAIRMPKRPIFTVYMVFMLFLHTMFVVDCVCIYYFNIAAFYCVSSVLLLIHYVLIGPLLFYAFLWDFVFPPANAEARFSELYYQAINSDEYASTNETSYSPWLLMRQPAPWPHD